MLSVVHLLKIQTKIILQFIYPATNHHTQTQEKKEVDDQQGSAQRNTSMSHDVSSSFSFTAAEVRQPIPEALSRGLLTLPLTLALPPSLPSYLRPLVPYSFLPPYLFPLSLYSTFPSLPLTTISALPPSLPLLSSL